MNLKNKKILITGASGELGKKLTSFFAKKGSKLFLIDKKKIKENNSIVSLQCDFTSEIDQKKLVNFLNHKVNNIDVLINNAAFTSGHNSDGWLEKLERQSLEQWKKCFEVNLNSAFLITRLLQKKIKKNKGCIINIGSIYSVLSPDPKSYLGTKMISPAAYSASKGGLLQLTRYLAAYLAPDIRVNMVSFIGIKRNQPRSFLNNYLKKIPLKKMCKEEDIINTIEFLISEKSRMITGQNLIIDGGYSII